MFVLRQLLCRHSDMHQALLRLLFNCSLRKANEHDKMCPSGLFLLTGAGKEGKAFGQGHELGQASLNEPVGQEARRGSAGVRMGLRDASSQPEPLPWKRCGPTRALLCLQTALLCRRGPTQQVFPHDVPPLGRSSTAQQKGMA